MAQKEQECIDKLKTKQLILREYLSKQLEASNEVMLRRFITRTVGGQILVRKDPESPDVQSHLSKLQDKASRLFQVDAELEILYFQQWDEDHYKEKLDEIELYRDKYFDIKAQMEHYLMQNEKK